MGAAASFAWQNKCPVETLLQLKVTSCGEAVIVIAYNYAHPETKIDEQEVIDFALKENYYTHNKAPFTSPADMGLPPPYTSFSTGKVTTADEGTRAAHPKIDQW